MVRNGKRPLRWAGVAQRRAQPNLYTLKLPGVCLTREEVQAINLFNHPALKGTMGGSPQKHATALHITMCLTEGRLVQKAFSMRTLSGPIPFRKQRVKS